MCNQRLLKRRSKSRNNNVAQAKKAEIDRNTKCDRRRKAAAKAKVDEAVNNAKASDQATNNNGVDTAKSGRNGRN